MNALSPQLELMPASEWCLRWQDRRHAWQHPDRGGFDRRRYDVAEIPYALARAFVERHHYSGRYVADRLRYGLFDGSRLVGAAVLSVPMSRLTLTNPFPGLVPLQESLELGRFVLVDEVPANGESFFLGQMFRLAKREGIAGVVSFSDPMPRYTSSGCMIFPGHIGTIYQASNAAYTGRARPNTLYILPDGRSLTARAISKMRAGESGGAAAEEWLHSYGIPARNGEPFASWLRRGMAGIGASQVRHPGNHRYVFRLGRRGRQMTVPELPYPKVAA